MKSIAFVRTPPGGSSRNYHLTSKPPSFLWTGISVTKKLHPFQVFPARGEHGDQRVLFRGGFPAAPLSDPLSVHEGSLQPLPAGKAQVSVKHITHNAQQSVELWARMSSHLTSPVPGLCQKLLRSSINAPFLLFLHPNNVWGGSVPVWIMVEARHTLRTQSEPCLHKSLHCEG